MVGAHRLELWDPLIKSKQIKGGHRTPGRGYTSHLPSTCLAEFGNVAHKTPQKTRVRKVRTGSANAEVH